MLRTDTPELYDELDRILEDTPCTDTWARAGDIVLYQANLMHVPMFNNFDATDPADRDRLNIRQACITGFGLTEAALPDDELTAHVDEGDLWRDWAPEVRDAPGGESLCPRL